MLSLFQVHRQHIANHSERSELKHFTVVSFGLDSAVSLVRIENDYVPNAA
jgi:hypothetical protein